MKIYIGSDHRGHQLAKEIVSWLQEENHEVEFVGDREPTPEDDYVDFGAEVGRKVASEQGTLGVAVCGSGVGMDVTANKIKGVRASLGYSEDQVKSARNDDDINVLALGSDFLDFEKAKTLVRTFIETRFAAEERFVRRVEKVKKLESV